MFKKLLVPLDGSTEAAAALPTAQVLARLGDGALTLLRVVHHPGVAATAEAERYLASVRDEVAASGLSVSTAVETGVPADAIVAAAVAEGADLIVMTTHARTGMPHLRIGSVAESVSALSPVPVVLVGPADAPTSKVDTILVPVDGTPGGSLALGAGIQLARASGARIVLLDVAVPVPFWMFSDQFGVMASTYVDPKWDEEALDAARGYVQGLAERVSLSGVQTEARAALGDPGEIIAQVARETYADLVVMSTHALTGLARSVMGSVAGTVVRISSMPVLLVRRDRTSDYGGTADAARGLSAAARS